MPVETVNSCAMLDFLEYKSAHIIVQVQGTQAALLSKPLKTKPGDWFDKLFR